MNAKQRVFLMIEGIVDLTLGAVLLFVPVGLGDVLGLPEAGTYFYSTVLGGVLFGIGIALFLELNGAGARGRGLGLSGATAINLCGGGALLVLLIAVPLDIPLRGHIILWFVAVLVLVFGLAELVSRSRNNTQGVRSRGI